MKLDGGEILLIDKLMVGGIVSHKHNFQFYIYVVFATEGHMEEYIYRIINFFG